MLKKQTMDTPAAAVETPQAATTTLPPETVVEQLRSLRAQCGEVSPLTGAQRKALRAKARTSGEILQASINVIGAADLIQQAVGQPAAEVREMVDEANRWSAVEDELRAMLNGIAGANLIRHQRLAAIASQAYGIGVQLARDPAHAALVPHVEEIKRMKRLQRRKKAAQPPATPAPAPGTPSPDGTSGKQKA